MSSFSPSTLPPSGPQISVLPESPIEFVQILDHWVRIKALDERSSFDTQTCVQTTTKSYTVYQLEVRSVGAEPQTTWCVYRR
jgi:hypothetical protein